MLARDRLGVKPLYWCDGPDGALRFASTLPALVAGGGVDTAVDPVALHHYLSLHSIVPPPRTILRGVRKLPPATVLVVEPDGRRRERRWWDPPFTRDPARADWTEADWEGALLDALRTAVERRMVADVPVGVLLSGGLDSSLIVALLARVGPARARDVLDRLPRRGRPRGRRVRVLRPRGARVRHRAPADPRRRRPARARRCRTAIAAMSEPMVSHDAVAFYLLSQEVARDRKVVQSGQGADEVLGGYYWYPPMLEAPGDGLDTYAGAFFDRDDAGVAALVADRHRRRRATRRARSRRAGSARRARTRRSTARCGSTPR